MARGTTQGPKTKQGYRTRRNSKPRVGSPDGIQVRHDLRASHTPTTSDKYRGGFRKAGSRNRRKVGR